MHARGGADRSKKAAAPEASHVSAWQPVWHPDQTGRKLLATYLVAARVVGDTRVNLLNASLSVRHPDGTVEHRTLADARDLGEVLTEIMGLDLPVPVEAIGAKLPSQSVPS